MKPKYMKKKLSVFLLCFSLGLISHTAMATSSTHSMRTSTGQIISVGDNYISMVDKIQQQPVSTRSYEVKEKSHKYTVNEYIYLVGNTYYTINIVNSSIHSITWDRKN